MKMYSAIEQRNEMAANKRILAINKTKILIIIVFALSIAISGCATLPYVNSELLSCSKKKIGVGVYRSMTSTWAGPINVFSQVKDHLSKNDWVAIPISMQDKRGRDKSLGRVLKETKKEGIPYFMIVYYYSYHNEGQLPSTGVRIMVKAFNTYTQKTVFTDIGSAEDLVIVDSHPTSTSCIAGYYPGSYQTTTTMSVRYYYKHSDLEGVEKEAVETAIKDFP